MAYVKSIFTMLVVPILYCVCVYLIFDISLTKLRELNPSGVGDFLAGVFSPLAFYFLVLGYIQNTNSLKIQAAELAASNKAFTAQVEEMRKSAETQERMFKLEVERLNAEKERAILKSIPKLVITASPLYLDIGSYFKLILNTEDAPVHNLKVTSRLWDITDSDGSTKQCAYISRLNPDMEVKLKVGNMRDDVWAIKEYLTIEFYGVNSQKVTEIYLVEQPRSNTDLVRLTKVDQDSV